MTRRRAPKPAPPAAPVTAPVSAPPRRRLHEADLLAIGTFLLCVVLGWATRNALNPDGVSYLDLARRLQEGDWGRFVQGYWSPVYPILLALVATVTGAESITLLAWVHALNVAIAGVGVAAVWRLARHRDEPRFTRAAFAILLLASARTPRLDAVSPDLLLVGLFGWIAVELLAHGGRRPVRLGLLLGGAFLVKTSGWPWFLVAVAVLIALAPDPAARRRVAAAASVAVAVMLLWIVPLSIRYGGPTLGTAGPLNYCWYLRACDSRSPDTHQGSHAAYRRLDLAPSVSITVASFGDGPWTWLPWSDPSAWAPGVESQGKRPPTMAAQFRYWGMQLFAVVGYWWLHILVAVLIPLAWLEHRPGRWRELLVGRSDALAAVLLGLAGVAQFVVVHAEPRLIAPYVLLASLGVAWWLTAAPPRADRTRRIVLIVTWLGLVTALPRSLRHVYGQALTADAVADRMEGLRSAHAEAQRNGMQGNGVVVVGAVFPLLADAWLLGVRIVGQIPPTSAARIAQRPQAEQVALLRALPEALRDQPAGAVWLSQGGGAFLVAPIIRRRE